jgi:protein-tyrosine phosphatase
MTGTSEFTKLLIVCVGNICRSPLAERLLCQGLPQINVSSAGIGALVGCPADETALAVARESGVDLDGHAARQLTAEIAAENDLILVLEAGHKREIVRKYPHLSGKVMLLDQWEGAAGIPDPYQRSREFHEQVFKMIDQASKSWIEKLSFRSEKMV